VRLLDSQEFLFVCVCVCVCGVVTIIAKLDTAIISSKNALWEKMEEVYRSEPKLFLRFKMQIKN
jgi:hypothetical protein